ncbi:RHS repeat domain-containing protein [Prevotella melaninogenica]
MHRKYMRGRSGRAIREERAGGRWTEYEYDQRGRLTRSSFSDGTIEAFSYDVLGRLTETRNATGSVSMEYDEGGRVVKECFSGGLPGDKGTTVENIYDDLGNRIETRTSLGSVVQNSFDEDGLLSRVTAASGGGENWEEKIVRDSEGLKIEKIFSGGIRMTRTYDAYGNVISQKSRSFRQDGYDRRYAWNASGRLQSVIDGITGGRTSYAYDAVGSLMSARYEDGTDDYRMPDATGNVFRSRDRRDREYGKGGRILRDRHYDFLYDVEGNLILKTPRRGLTQHPNHEVSEESGTHIVWQTGDYAYEWYGNGMLKEVRLPYGKTVRFEYDALGRRTAKLFNGHVFRYLWDGNVMVQEWQYEEKDRPQHSIDEFGRIRMQGEEPVENLVTWVYEEGSYVPVAKIQNGERYTIISDYMGRPVEAYNSYGNVVWQADYDIYGDLRNIKGIRDFIPFRQLGQYEDDETRLYYNRFRYYDPRIGNYISQDPIRLAGNNPTLYGYVEDLNNWADVFGLRCKKVKKIGPSIPEFHRKNFTDGIVNMRQVSGDEIFYKYHGKSNRLGREYNYVTNKKYLSEQALREDLALLKEWGVKIEYVTTFKPQAGTWIGEGTAAKQISQDGTEILEGTGYQGIINIKELPNSTIIKTEKVKFSL